jgi:hypothetical protein
MIVFLLVHRLAMPLVLLPDYQTPKSAICLLDLKNNYRLFFYLENTYSKGSAHCLLATD